MFSGVSVWPLTSISIHLRIILCIQHTKKQKRARNTQQEGEKGRGRTYTSMSTISTTALLRRLIHLDVLDDQVSGVEAFGVGVRFCVFEEAEEEFGGFFGPAGFGDAELFSWGRGGGVSAGFSFRGDW